MEKNTSNLISSKEDVAILADTKKGAVIYQKRDDKQYPIESIDEGLLGARQEYFKSCVYKKYPSLNFGLSLLSEDEQRGFWALYQERLSRKWYHKIFDESCLFVLMLIVLIFASAYLILFQLS